VNVKWKSKLGVHPQTGAVLNMQYVDEQAAGAMRNGSRIKKRNSEEGDSQVNGAKGTIIGSFATPKEMLGEKLEHEFFDKFGLPTHGYFVEWDALPGIIVGTTNLKVEPVDAEDAGK